ncbi:Myosin-17 [Vitis vinifera]|uniref:Myosin-17 n=1 Tax=Vitis vinifera TaxID=29760 RepID=A0A438J420_VITVI|nr:Myosin-17 [Vitis vinifera]
MEETGYVMRTEFQHAPLDYIMFFYSIFFNSSVTNGRLEEKLSNLESDNQVLRQQALTILATAKALYARPKTPTLQRTPENGNVLNGEAKKQLARESRENQDLLIKCISQDLRFCGGRPIAACLIYKSLFQWRSFEVERTSVFDRIIQTIGAAIEYLKVQDNNDVLSFWLCNSSTLLLLLQCTLKASGTASLTPQRRRSTSTSFFGRMSQVLRASPQSIGFTFLNGQVLGGLDDLRQVEAKYLALYLFIIQAPRTSRASLVKGRSQANVVAQQALIAHWQSIVKSLNYYLKIMKANHVSPFLLRKVLTQIHSSMFSYSIGNLLLRRKCCSFSNEEFVKSGLAELENWCHEATEEYAGSTWDELRHIK